MVLIKRDDGVIYDGQGWDWFLVAVIFAFDCVYIVCMY